MSSTNIKVAKFGFAVIMVTLTSGFIFPKKYGQPEPAAAAATLVITKSQSEIENPSPLEPTRYFDAYDDSSCSTRGRGGFLGTLRAPSGDVLSKLISMKNEDSKEFRVAADQPLYLKVKAVAVLDSRRRAFKARHCTNLVSFTPLEGHRYEAQQMSTEDRCLLLVTDSDTGRVPDDFEVVPISGACHDE
jgi:hypothetical protein